MNRRITNAVVFQIGWWIAVLGAGWGHPWFGTLLVEGLVAVNVGLSVTPRTTVRIVFMAGLVGALLDSALGSLGILLFVDNPLSPWFCPPWLIALWCLFATTLNSSLQWLAGRDWLAAFVGGIFGPLSYSGGQALGAMALGPDAIAAVVVLAGLWAVMLPVFVRLAANIARRR